MKAFVQRLRKAKENLSNNEEFFSEKKQMNSLQNYYSHSMLYLERLERATKDINIMINDLNNCLMSFFENDINKNLIIHVSYILKSFNEVGNKINIKINYSKETVNYYLNKIKNIKKLFARKKQLSSDIQHYEKKIKRLHNIDTPSHKILEKILRNENKLNKVKSEYLNCYENIKNELNYILDNKMNKVLFDAKNDLEILLYYFSLMNSISLKLKDPLNAFDINTCRSTGYINTKDKNDSYLENNFFLNEENKLNYFSTPKNNNPFSADLDSFKNTTQHKDKKNPLLSKLNNIIKGNDKSLNESNEISCFPQ